MAKPNYAPDYVDRDGLAYRLSIRAGAIDQYVKRGILPPPIFIGEAKRWRWSAVEARIEGVADGGDLRTDEAPDPYLAGIRNAAKPTAARPQSAESDGADILPISKTSRNQSR